MAQTINPRKKKLDAICRKIALFIVQETFTDERDLQQRLSEAVNLISGVADTCVVNDKKIEQGELDPKGSQSNNEYCNL